MKKAFIIAAAMAGTANAGGWEEVRDLCESRWPAPQYSMQKFCIKEQHEAALTVSHFADEANGNFALMGILVDCGNRWRTDAYKGRDWPMVAFCYQEERKAYISLQNGR